MLRALVVDDDRVLRTTLIEVLTEAGYEAIEAENGHDALFILKKDSNFTVILSDIQMPKVNGIQLFEVLTRNYAAIPVVMLSAYAGLAARAQRKGVTYYLPKPFSRRQLINMLRQATGQESKLPSFGTRVRPV